MAIRSFKDLNVWQRSMDLIPEIYLITSKLPETEKYGLSNQLQRASVSIPSNIAEGSKRSSRVDFRQFCKIALGSAAEVETQLLVVRSVYPSVSTEDALSIVIEVQKMLSSLVNKLKTDPKNYKL